MTPPEAPPAKFGHDEWVSQVDKRRAGPGGPVRRLLDRWNEIPLSWRLVGLLVVGAAIPLVSRVDAGTIEMARITVPAFLTKSHPRSNITRTITLTTAVRVAFHSMRRFAFVPSR